MLPNLPRYARFVEMTKSQRLPKIVGHLLNDSTSLGFTIDAGALLAPTDNVLDRMRDHLANAPWQRWFAQLGGRGLSELPFLDYEYVWYINVLVQSGYFSTGVDPYRLRKWEDFGREFAAADQRFAEMPGLVDALSGALMGNSADLSQLGGPEHAVVIEGVDEHPIDTTAPLDIVADNFGREFLDDLLLATTFYRITGQSVRIHVKQLPLFVSDTTAADCAALLDCLTKDESAFARTLLSYLDSGVVSFLNDPFWSSPHDLSTLPTGLAGHRTILIKGDLNYRKAIGDAVTRSDTPFSDLTVLPEYPLISLRSVKSYCLAGVRSARVDPMAFAMDGTLFLAQSIPARR